MDGGAEFGEALQRHRHAQRLTQAELAEKAGLSERAISDLERGLKHPQRATVRLLIQALGLPPAQARGALELAARTRVAAPEPIATGMARHNLPASPDELRRARPGRDRAQRASSQGAAADADRDRRLRQDAARARGRARCGAELRRRCLAGGARSGDGPAAGAAAGGWRPGYQRVP